eukprot:276367_1
MATLSASTQSAMEQRYLQLFQTTNDQRFCDVTFVIGASKRQYPVNRMIMASLSTVFKAMLYGNMKESQPNAQVVIVDVSPNAFESVLKFAYCNDPRLTAQNVIGVMKMCDKYQITALTNLCRVYLDNCANHNNICVLLNDLTKHQFKSGVLQVGRIGQHAGTIVQSQAFREMTLNAMKEFLSWDSLCIKESVLWDVVVKWAEYQASNITEPPKKKRKRSKTNNTNSQKKMNVDTKKMKKLLKAVCPQMRFGLMPGNYFVRNVKPHNCLTTKEIADILCHIQCKELPCGNFSTKRRQSGSSDFDY